MHSVFLILIISLSKCYANDDNRLVFTPHGLRPKKCVIYHNESEVILDHTPNGVWAHYPQSNSKKFFTALPECIENSKDILDKYFAKNKNRNNQDELDDDHGWEIYVKSETNPLSNFSGYIGVPNENLPMSSLMIAYFIGAGSNEGETTNCSAALLQPAVVWCGNGGCDVNDPYQGKWNYASWQCCPHGSTHRAGPNYEGTLGENIFSYAWSDPETGHTEVYMRGKNGVSSLKNTCNYMKHNLPDLTLEIWQLDGQSCDHLNDKPVVFSQLKMIDTDGKQIDMPGIKWNYQDKNPLGCGGEGKWNSPTNFQITAAK